MTTPALTQPVDSIQPASPIDAVEPVNESDDDDGPTCMQAVLDALGMTGRAFAHKHGFNAGTIYGFANGSRAPLYGLLWDICEAEPRISAEFLLRGEGKPLRDLDAVQVATLDQLNTIRAEVIATLDRQLDQIV